MFEVIHAKLGMGEISEIKGIKDELATKGSKIYANNNGK